MPSRYSQPKSVLITGASSGIGASLATAYAAPDTAVALIGRNAERLAGIADRCRTQGASVRSATLDVTDRDTLRGWMSEVDQEAGLDLVIANAGVSAGTGEGGEDEAQLRRILGVNIDGVINTVCPAIDLMRPRRHGQIGIVSSLAGFRGFPGAPGYCASKAAARVWGESLRGHLHAEGIGVSVICPGFVETRMTGVNRFPMPFLQSSDQAARTIRRGLARNKARITFPWPLAAAIWLIAALPPAWTDAVLRRLPEKS